MATSPIYSWPEPDNTDLVKNGALAIRTMGNAIDTTMATMTPKSTYTAKGSIAAATAASTPANLSVGANDTMLVADSTAATGLAYKSASTLYPWTSYTPVVSQTGTRTATVSYAKSQRIGNMMTVQVMLTITQAGVAGNRITVSLPAAFANSSARATLGSFMYLDAGTAFYAGIVNPEGASSVAFTTNNSTDFFGANPSLATANNDTLSFSICYEVA
jgi:hypothetical protein